MFGAVPARSMQRPEEFIGQKYWSGPDHPDWHRKVEWLERVLVTARRQSALRERHGLTLPSGEATIHDAVVRYTQGAWSITCVDLRPGSHRLRMAMGKLLGRLRRTLHESLEGCVIDRQERIWWWTKGLEEATGIAAGSMLGRTLPRGLTARLEGRLWAAPIPLREDGGAMVASLVVLHESARRASKVALVGLFCLIA